MAVNRIFGDKAHPSQLIFPTLAEHAPELTDAAGSLFTGRILGFYIMFAVTNMIGMIFLGIAAHRAKAKPRIAAFLEFTTL